MVHSTLLPSLYGTATPLPGKYNTSWDNPTWFPNSYPSNFPNSTTPAVGVGESSEATVVIPNGSNKGCVSWGAMVMSVTVQDSDHDGLLDVWKSNQGYCDAGSSRGMSNQGVCGVGDSTDPAWVALPNAHSPGQGNQDVFVQLDYMCTKVANNPDGTTTCDTATGGVSYRPSAATITTFTRRSGMSRTRPGARITPPPERTGGRRSIPKTRRSVPRVPFATAVIRWDTTPQPIGLRSGMSAVKSAMDPAAST